MLCWQKTQNANGEKKLLDQIVIEKMRSKDVRRQNAWSSEKETAQGISYILGMTIKRVQKFNYLGIVLNHKAHKNGKKCFRN